MENEPITTPEKNNSRWIPIALIILGIGAIAAALFFGLKYFGRDDANDTKKEESSVLPTSSSSSSRVERSSSSVSVSSTSSSAANNWSHFINTAHSYSVDYPAGFTVTNASDSPEDETKTAAETNCLLISNKYVTVKISALGDEEPPSYCLNTGFGQEWSSAPKDNLNIAGTDYVASGMKTEAASAGYYKALYSIQALDGRVIEYGIDVNEKYDSAMTKAAALALAHQIISSYTPAE